MSFDMREDAPTVRQQKVINTGNALQKGRRGEAVSPRIRVMFIVGFGFQGSKVL